MNPHRLEPFYEATRRKVKDQMTRNDTSAWLIGSYVRDAIAACFAKNVSYPKKPRGIDTTENEEADTKHGKPKTDGENFALFAMSHNKVIQHKKDRKKIKEQASA